MFRIFQILLGILFNTINNLQCFKYPIRLYWKLIFVNIQMMCFNNWPENTNIKIIKSSLALCVLYLYEHKCIHKKWIWIFGVALSRAGENWTLTIYVYIIIIGAKKTRQTNTHTHSKWPENQFHPTNTYIYIYIIHQLPECVGARVMRVDDEWGRDVWNKRNKHNIGFYNKY